MDRPPEMIKCGWEGCGSWFSTGVDMNQHVLINHIKYMKIQFGDVDRATVEPKTDPSEIPKTPKKSEVQQVVPSVSTTPLRQFPQSTSWAVPTHDAQMHQHLGHLPTTSSLIKSLPNPHTPDAPADRKSSNLQFYDDEEEIIMIEQPMSAVSTVPSEVSQEPDEVSSGRMKKRQYEYDEEGEEVDMDLASMTTERAPGGESSKKARKSGDRVDQNGERIPWSLARAASHIPQPEIRLSTSFNTVGEMARAIAEELTVRKTLRKKNHSNGNYCVVCLDYRKDNGFCDYMHNNQHEYFIQFYHTLYKNERVSKQTLLQFLTEMQILRDPLPELSTSLVRAPF